MQSHPAPRKLRLVLLAGLPLSGKTRLALKLRELGWDHIQYHSESNVASLQDALRSSLQAGRDVVVDSTNLTKAHRAQWWSVAAQVAPPTADGGGGVSQFVVISAVIPTGEEAERLDPAHLQYRQQYLSPEYTAYLPSEKVVEYIHNVISALDPAFEVPYTTEGVDSLAHVRTQHEFDLVLGWLSHAVQFSASQKAGWGTPPPSSAAAAAAQWCEAHNVAKHRLPPAASLLPPAPDFMLNAVAGPPAAQPSGHLPDAGQQFQETQPFVMGQSKAMNGSTGFLAEQGLANGVHPGQFPRPLSFGHTQATASPAPTASAPFNVIGSAAPFSPASGTAHVPQLQYSAAVNGAHGQMTGAQAPPGLAAAVQLGPTWPSEVPMPARTEFDVVPAKRPYDHGPGASELPWASADVKRPNVLASLEFANAPSMQQGLPQSAFQAQPPALVVPHTALQGGQVVVQQRPGFVVSQAPFNGTLPQQFALGAPTLGVGYSQQLSGTPGEPRRTGPPAPLSVDMSDPRPIILFELSGVLCNSTKDRMNTRTRNHQPRPGVGQLARLMPHFRIGVFSTATRKTVLAALAVVSSAIRGEIASSRDGWQLLLGGAPPSGEQTALESGDDAPRSLYVPPEHRGLPRVGLTTDDVRGSLAWACVFEEGLILHRDHTDVTLLEDRELTVKSLKALFPDPHTLRRILVVDEPHINQADDSFIAVRRWDTESGALAARSDAQIPALVASLLAHLPDAGDDVRSISRRVTQEVKAALAVVTPRAAYRPTDLTDGYFESYPQRPGAEPCQFFLETGHCRFGEGCHFHHPLERRVKLNRAGFPMRAGKAVCSTYVDTGFCDYGKSCMKHHPNLEVVEGVAAAQEAAAPASGAALFRPPPMSNFLVVEEDWTAAFPQRPGELACALYVQTGFCRFGQSCKFHHPLDVRPPLNNHGLPMRLNAPVCDFFCRTGQCGFGVACTKHHPNLVPGWDRGQGSGWRPGLMAEDAPARGGRAEGLRGPPSGHIPRGSVSFEVVDGMDGFFAEFAANPGKEPCPNFMRTGHCKFGLTCQFDHPPEFMVKLNLLGLPLRPGAELCKFYLNTGECGYGRQCMFHHPNIAPQGGLPISGLAQNPARGAPPQAPYEPAPRFAPLQRPVFVAPQTMVIVPQQHW